MNKYLLSLVLFLFVGFVLTQNNKKYLKKDQNNSQQYSEPCIYSCRLEQNEFEIRICSYSSKDCNQKIINTNNIEEIKQQVQKQMAKHKKEGIYQYLTLQTKHNNSQLKMKVCDIQQEDALQQVYQYLKLLNLQEISNDKEQISNDKEQISNDKEQIDQSQTQNNQLILNSKFQSIAYILQAGYQGTLEERFGANSCYDIIILSFYLTNGPWDSVNIYNQLSIKEKEELFEIFNKKNKKLFISIFGGTNFPTNDNPESTAINVVKFLKNQRIHGVDINYEDNESFNNGKAVDWVVRFQQKLSLELKEQKMNLLITHAPQAPYFSCDYYKNLSSNQFKNRAYCDIHQKVGHLINWYHVQFYNQMDTRYDTYETLYLESTGKFVKSAVKEIHEIAGVDYQKIVLGKVTSVNDQGSASNTGYVPVEKLSQIIKQGIQDGIQLPGFFIWKYDSDRNSDFVKKLMSGIGQQSSC